MHQQRKKKKQKCFINTSSSIIDKEIKLKLLQYDPPTHPPTPVSANVPSS